MNQHARKKPISGIIDIHCHILPQIDDGPKNLKEALDMARMAVAEGTALIVATSHITPGVYDNTPEQIRSATVAFQQALVEANIPLKVIPGAEIRYHAGIMGLWKQGRLPFYGYTLSKRGGKRKYFLLEFPHQKIPAGALYFVDLLMNMGITPVIAHPERNRAIRKDIEVLAPFIHKGCLSQATAASLTGGFGAGVGRVVEKLLERGWVHLLASDGHGFYQRQPVVVDGLRVARKLMGEDRANKLVFDHPKALLLGEPIAF
ncbi:tyrosine-protein phosphatase [Magnetococcales bacterium HHB-1]